VTGSVAHFNLDRWRALFGADGAAPAQDLKPALSNLRIAVLDLGGKRVHDVTLRAPPAQGDNTWTVNVKAKELQGNVTWRPEGGGRIMARLDRFVVPENAPESERVPTASSRDMPALDIVAESFTLHDMSLGKLELLAANEAGENWRIEKLVLANDDGTLTANGEWENWRAQPTVNLDLNLDVHNIGKFLDRVGFPGTMRGGTAKLKAKIAWSGMPSSVDYATLGGELQLSASKGQFLKVEPGAAKLLGVLSLQSWVTFDFRRLFSQGFAFDSVSSTAKIANGVMSTQDFHMRGPSAQVTMSGTVDLVHESQNLRVRVAPSLGDAASYIPAILVNPVWGFGAFVLQRFFKDPLGQIFAFEYDVTGTWMQPVAKPVRGEVRTAVEAGPPP
jgi:uncharacterized protein YhdP